MNEIFKFRPAISPDTSPGMSGLLPREWAPSTPPRDFVAAMRRLATERPADIALIIVNAQGDTVIDYAGLDRRVRALAARLQADYAPGDRALLTLNNDLDYVIAYFACLYAGLIAVTAFPPETTRERHLARLASIAADARPRCVLATTAIFDMMGPTATIFDAAQTLAVDMLDIADADRWREHRPRLDDVAFLQYTSGSTSTPKGVMVSHANLMANERALEEALAVGADDVFVTWLPLYHDMGLVAGLLQPFHRGVPVVLMSPSYFLERPVRWLEAISRHRGTVSGGPDFAYRLCVDQIRDGQLAGLDLSSWRLAFSGAEPVRPRTVEDFITRFTPCGFAAEAVYPCYGMAEATLIATGGRAGSGAFATGFAAADLAQGIATDDLQGARLVACGAAPSAHQVEIVAPETQEALPDGRIGEIWLAGPSIAQGYWGRPEASAETFVAWNGGRWLRTGDLGFRYGGEVFIAGRRKDLIILRGQNVYPQDLEQVVEDTVSAVRRGRVAAFLVEKADGSEGVGIAAEISRPVQKKIHRKKLAAMLNEAVADACLEPAAVIVLLNPRGMPKTSSGKLQRAACRRGWRERTLDAYAIWENGRFVFGDDAIDFEEIEAQPLDGVAAALAAIWREALDRRAPGVEIARGTHFFAAGGDSLAAVVAAAAIARRWGIAFPASGLFQFSRLGDCATEIGRRLVGGSVEAGFTGAEGGPIPVGGPQRRQQSFPLSPAQARQWFLWRLDPDGVVNHISGALRLSDALDVAALRAAFQAVVARHEALRTVFIPTADGLAEQRVLAAPSIELPLIAVDDGTPEEREAAAQGVVRALAAQPFDLTGGPPVRAALVCVDPSTHLLGLTLHHIIADGESLRVIFDELADFYGRFVAGGDPAVSSPPLQYPDYALWQHERPNPEREARALAYWLARLGDSGPVLALAADRPRLAESRFSAGRRSFALPDDLLTGLRGTAAAQGVTLFAALLTGFMALLARYTGQKDIRIGTPAANRPQSECAGAVGLFVNTLVLKADVKGQTTLTHLLAQVSDATAGALAHQDLPFDRLVEALQPERSLSHNPLVQVTANHLTEDFSAFDAIGLRAEWQPVQPAVQFELTLETCEKTDGSVVASLIYAADLFEPQTMAALAEHYLVILRHLAGNPGRRVADIPMLTDDDLRRQAAWGGVSAAIGTDPPIHRLIAAQARAHPHATALVEGDHRLSYGSLNRLSNRLARRLRASGVGPDVRVGVAVERSMAMIVSLLAVLKAGGAYVPLDPDYPADRLAHMVADSGLALLLVSPSASGRLPRPTGVAIVEIDQGVMVEPDGAVDDDGPVVPLHRENLAYVIYTSGSTGRPKGVGVAHGPLSAHLRAVSEVYGVAEGHRELMFFSLSFDAAAEQWMTPLRGGGAIVLSTREQLAVDSFVRLMDEAQVTALHIPPAYLRVLAPMAGAAGHRIRSCIVGGEAWPFADFVAAQHAFPHARLVNAYGPTETVITPTAWVGDAKTPAGTGYTPIGRPVGARGVYVLDADLNLLPVGAVGEVYVGGYELARGYLGRPGLTADRFVTDPFAVDGGRLYRTGDRACWRTDGQLEYLGRVDHQVKVRGFRIELGEIEAQLLAIPGVREAVAITRGDDDNARIIAYVRLDSTASFDGGALKAALATALPDYMLPAAVVPLDRLPLTPNGKIDRQALPEPETAVGDVLPATPREAAIAQIWAEVLGVARVGLHDNFFDLGGHSVQLIKVHSRLREELGLKVTLVDLFRCGSVSALVAHLGRGAGVGLPSGSPPAEPSGPPGALSPAQIHARAQAQRRHFVPRRNKSGRISSGRPKQ